MIPEEDCGSEVGMERESDSANEESLRPPAARSHGQSLVCGVPKVVS